MAPERCRVDRVARHHRSVRRSAASDRRGDAGAVRKVRPSLDSIVGMIAQDPAIERLAPDFTRPEPPPMSPERLADYRERLEEGRHRARVQPLRRYHRIHRLDAGPLHQRKRQEASCIESADPDATVIDGDLDAAAATPPPRTPCCNGGSTITGGCSWTGAEAQPRVRGFRATRRALPQPTNRSCPRVRRRQDAGATASASTGRSVTARDSQPSVSYGSVRTRQGRGKDFAQGRRRGCVCVRRRGDVHA